MGKGMQKEPILFCETIELSLLFFFFFLIKSSFSDIQKNNHSFIVFIQPCTSSPTSMYTNHPILLHSFIWVVKQGILHVPPPPPPPPHTHTHTHTHPFQNCNSHHACIFKSPICAVYRHIVFVLLPLPIHTLQNSQHHTCAFKLHDSQTEHTYTHASPSLTNSINQAHCTCTSAKPPLIHRINLAQHTSASPSLIHRINQAQHTLLFPHSSSIK